jgi:hypothetical protein
VTEEQRRHRSISAQPFGRRAFRVRAALLAPYRSLRICSSLAPCQAPKFLAASCQGLSGQHT